MCRSEEPEAHKDSDLSKITDDCTDKNKTRTQNSSYNIKINYTLERRKKKGKEILICIFLLQPMNKV